MAAYREGKVAGPELEKIIKKNNHISKYTKTILSTIGQLFIISNNCLTTILYVIYLMNYQRFTAIL